MYGPHQVNPLPPSLDAIAIYVLESCLQISKLSLYNLTQKTKGCIGKKNGRH